MFAGVDRGYTAPPFSDAIIFVMVRVAVVGAVMVVLSSADASVSGKPTAGVR